MAISGFQISDSISRRYLLLKDEQIWKPGIAIVSR